MTREKLQQIVRRELDLPSAWAENVATFSIHPEAASRKDVADMAQTIFDRYDAAVAVAEAVVQHIAQMVQEEYDAAIRAMNNFPVDDPQRRRVYWSHAAQGIEPLLLKLKRLIVSPSPEGQS